MSSNFKIAVLVSGNGSNLQSLIDAKKNFFFNSEIKIVISNNNNSYALKRANNNNIKNIFINNDNDLNEILIKEKISLIILAGYLKIIPDFILKKYLIINIHPSLLPKYGGKGMYGLHVHKEVFKNKEIYSGATVHQVTNIIDGGKIIIQEKVNISDCKSPESIQIEVLKVEHNILKKAIKIIEEENIIF